MPFFKLLGMSIVACFFLMSGYGLMTSYLKKKDAYMEHFLSHRFKAILIPYFVTLVLCILYKTFKNSSSLWDYFTDTPFEQFVPNTWFVWVLLGGYVVFWLIFRCNLSIRIKIVLFAAISLCYFVICYLVGIAVYWYYSSPAILVGLVWRYKEKAIMEFISKYICVFPTISILVCIILKFLHMNINNILVLSICIMFIWIVYIYNERWFNNKVTNFLGGISYEVYLCHGILVGINVDFTNYNILNLILLIVTTIIFSVFVNNVSNLIKRML